MSDQIKHECGIALIRLRKPLEYYQEKYGTWRYGLHKLHLLMEKQHNRGQDGAGFASVKLNVKPGTKYFDRIRSNHSTPIKDAFGQVSELYSKFNNDDLNNVDFARKNVPFAGELYLGHLRYGTFGNNDISYVHPVVRANNWKSKNLVLAGNFNLTNVDEIFNNLVEYGQHPKDYSDTVTILENIGHFLDIENQRIFDYHKATGKTNAEISNKIESEIDIAHVLRTSSKRWDGGYAIGGMVGHGDSFVVRDPWGIRPAFYYQDEEIVVIASERPVIQTVMNVDINDVKEIKPGHAIVIKQDGSLKEEEIREPKERKSCSFERIYFSRGSDASIYEERKKLGELLTERVLKAVDFDIDNTVFSYIPNTAETAFYGLVKGVENYLTAQKKKEILELGDALTPSKLDKILNAKPRVEKIAIKDAKLRTFITEDNSRDDLVGHVYDTTYGIVKNHIDNLVILDDSIVRGTTLKKSIIKILDRLNPKKIVIVSSAPQIRYPDCYGIDMAKLGDFIAFKAAIQLIKDNGQEQLIEKVYKDCIEEVRKPKEKIENKVKQIFDVFSAEQISQKISEMLKTEEIHAEVEVIYQSIEGLHEAVPNDTGDWYFTGNYPTCGGMKVVNRSFINYIEGINERAY
ncbi:MAG: amidophosphoribosyltransferase [Bacteroidales bacterium]|nr:amidophosphoribosyltransferase [Bacteroidales bacterium]